MKATNLWMRTTPFLLALLLGLLNWTAEPVSAQAESDGRLQPYWMAATTPPDGQTLLRTLDTPNPQEGAGFGRSMAMGNVNGDGKADVAVGVPSEDVGGNADQGRAYVFSGTSGSLLFTLNTPNPQAYASFGFSLAVGDVNDDGKADIAVGAPGEDVGDNNSQGRVYVFSSADGSLLFTLDTPNPQAGVTFGRSLAMGDVNGDGKGDIVVGAPFAQVGDNYNQGRAYIFSGTDGSLLLTLDTPQPAGMGRIRLVAGSGERER